MTNLTLSLKILFFTIKTNTSTNKDFKEDYRGGLFSAIMSTGRICPCIKDNKENIARQSVWQNAGEWNRQGAAFAKKLSWFKLNAAGVISCLFNQSSGYLSFGKLWFLRLFCFFALSTYAQLKSPEIHSYASIFNPTFLTLGDLSWIQRCQAKVLLLLKKYHGSN